MFERKYVPPEKRAFFWWEAYGDIIIIVSPSANNVSRAFRIESINVSPLFAISASPCVYESEPLQIEENISGSVVAKARPGFIKLIERMESGDVLVVTKLDRLGRNAMDVRVTVEQLAKNGVRVHCLALGGVDLTSPAGKMTMQVIAAVAEFERDLIIERTQSGILRAKATGKKFGRPSVLCLEDRSIVCDRLTAGATISAVAREFKTTRQTIMRVKESILMSL